MIMKLTSINILWKVLISRGTPINDQFTSYEGIPVYFANSDQGYTLQANMYESQSSDSYYEDGNYFLYPFIPGHFFLNPLDNSIFYGMPIYFGYICYPLLHQPYFHNSHNTNVSNIPVLSNENNPNNTNCNEDKLAHIPLKEGHSQTENLELKDRLVQTDFNFENSVITSNQSQKETLNEIDDSTEQITLAIQKEKVNEKLKKQKLNPISFENNIITKELEENNSSCDDNKITTECAFDIQIDDPKISLNEQKDSHKTEIRNDNWYIYKRRKIKNKSKYFKAILETCEEDSFSDQVVEEIKIDQEKSSFKKTEEDKNVNSSVNTKNKVKNKSSNQKKINKKKKRQENRKGSYDLMPAELLISEEKANTDSKKDYTNEVIEIDKTFIFYNVTSTHYHYKAEDISKIRSILSTCKFDDPAIDHKNIPDDFIHFFMFFIDFDGDRGAADKTLIEILYEYFYIFMKKENKRHLKYFQIMFNWILQDKEIYDILRNSLGFLSFFEEKSMLNRGQMIKVLTLFKNIVQNLMKLRRGERYSFEKIFPLFFDINHPATVSYFKDLFIRELNLLKDLKIEGVN